MDLQWTILKVYGPKNVVIKLMDLPWRLNLIEEEEAMVEFSDAEEEDEPAPVEWAESI